MDIHQRQRCVLHKSPTRVDCAFRSTNFEGFAPRFVALALPFPPGSDASRRAARRSARARSSLAANAGSSCGPTSRAAMRCGRSRTPQECRIGPASMSAGLSRQRGGGRRAGGEGGRRVGAMYRDTLAVARDNEPVEVADFAAFSPAELHATICRRGVLQRGVAAEKLGLGGLGSERCPLCEAQLCSSFLLTLAVIVHSPKPCRVGSTP